MRTRSDLSRAILHPTRARLITMLSQRPQTPRELHAIEPTVPLGTLYRHLNVLLEAGIIKVIRERRIHGTVERQFALEEGASYYTESEAAQMPPKELARIAGVLCSIVSQEFERYIDTSKTLTTAGPVSMVATSLLLSDDEVQELRRLMSEYVRKEGREPAAGLKPRLVAFFSVPQPVNSPAN